MLFKIPLVSTGRVRYEHYCQDHHGHEQDSDGGQGQLGHLARLSLPLLEPQIKVRKDFTYQANKHGKGRFNNYFIQWWHPLVLAKMMVE